MREVVENGTGRRAAIRAPRWAARPAPPSTASATPACRTPVWTWAQGDRRPGTAGGGRGGRGGGGRRGAGTSAGRRRGTDRTGGDGGGTGSPEVDAGSTSRAQGIDELADRQSHKGDSDVCNKRKAAMTTLTEADALDGLRDALGLLKDREQVAQRLLDSSAKHSFDPDKELDWDAPFEEGKWFWPPELVSLYDTPLWKRISEEQRILLSQHEAAALASLGIWFEIILMQLLVRHIYTSGDERARALRAHRDRGRVPALQDVRPPDIPRRHTLVPGQPRAPAPGPPLQDHLDHSGFLHGDPARRGGPRLDAAPDLPRRAGPAPHRRSPASTSWRRPATCATPARNCAARW
ncbi:hypothetical protein SVIOM74S_02534 [Streptomyces violarus]